MRGLQAQLKKVNGRFRAEERPNEQHINTYSPCRDRSADGPEGEMQGLTARIQPGTLQAGADSLWCGVDPLLKGFKGETSIDNDGELTASLFFVCVCVSVLPVPSPCVFPL